jgi:formamidopyrimidine-DNA glycosylase
MDQTLAAGLGNLIVDEALWQARIDPRRAVASLDDGERSALYGAIQQVLRDSVLRDSLPYRLVPGKRTWLTGARGGLGAGCPRCGATPERVTIAGRTTVFCPREQA